MPRTKKRKLEEEQDEPVATLYERWDVDALRSIAELALEHEVDDVVCSILSGLTRKTRRVVQYRPGKFQEGRLYGTGYQGVSGWIRKICGHKFYHDIDISNCALCLMYKMSLWRNLKKKKIEVTRDQAKMV